MTVTYTIHNLDVRVRERTCPSLLSEREESELLLRGAVVPAARLSTDQVETLRAAVDAQAARRFASAHDKTYSEGFAGQYVRDPHRADPRFLTIPLLDYPLADTARNLLGPRIVLRNSNIRITQPSSGDGTVWHTDFRPHVTPVPPLGAPPAVLTALVYLDRTDARIGALSIVPSSHTWPEQPHPDTEDRPGQVEIVVEPGQVVLMNAATWHRGGSNESSSRVRRLVTLQLSSVLLAPFNFDQATTSEEYLSLVDAARDAGDEGLLELLGIGGLDPSSSRY